MTTRKLLSNCRISYKTCSVCQTCLPFELDADDLAKLDGITRHAVPLQRDDYLFHYGDMFTAVYVVRSGILKTFTTTNDGKEQITGFCLPGQIIGLNALVNDRHGTGAQVLEASSVCKIPYLELGELTSCTPGLQRQLLQSLSREIVLIKKTLILLGKKSAEERLAIFLLHIADYSKMRGYTYTSFNLGISRSDIANFLGLSTETISRLFARFQGLGMLSAHCKHVEIHDIEAMRKLASRSDSYGYPVQHF